MPRSDEKREWYVMHRQALYLLIALSVAAGVGLGMAVIAFALVVGR